MKKVSCGVDILGKKLYLGDLVVPLVDLRLNITSNYNTHVGVLVGVDNSEEQAVYTIYTEKGGINRPDILKVSYSDTRVSQIHAEYLNLLEFAHKNSVAVDNLQVGDIYCYKHTYVFIYLGKYTESYSEYARDNSGYLFYTTQGLKGVKGVNNLSTLTDVGKGLEGVTNSHVCSNLGIFTFKRINDWYTDDTPLDYIRLGKSKVRKEHLDLETII